MSNLSSLDPYTILASLDIQDVSQAEPVTGGADTAIWRVIWREQACALRVFRPEQLRTFEREVTAMQIAAAGGISVPEVIKQGMWNERPVLLLSWIRGTTLVEELRAYPRRGWRLGKAFGQMQAAIHQMPIAAEANATDWIEWAGDERELKARLYNLKSRKAALLHLDYHPLNVMTDETRISGVLDWANARVGDPRADFARTYTILRIEPLKSAENSPRLFVFRRILERAWRTGYLQAGGKLDEMALFYAWAGAVMVDDLGARTDKPGFWLKHHHLDSVRRWRDGWKRRAGIYS